MPALRRHGLQDRGEQAVPGIGVGIPGAGGGAERARENPTEQLVATEGLLVARGVSEGLLDEDLIADSDEHRAVESASGDAVQIPFEDGLQRRLAMSGWWSAAGRPA